MSIQFELLDKLVEYEKRFENEVREKEIKLLRDICITEDDYNEIVELLKALIKSKNFKSIYNKGRLTLSLYLVWCSVYNYKDGDMWTPILSGISIKNTPQNSRLIGELFLDTINKYKMLTVSENIGKKYFSQIMLHGYICNDQTSRLFDVLNRYYDNLLDRDTSLANIESVWDLMFPVDDNYINNKQLRKNLEDEIKNLEIELSKSGNIEYFIDITREKLTELENEAERINLQIEEYALKKVYKIMEPNSQSEVSKLSDEILNKIDDISSKDYVQELASSDLINYIKNSFLEIKKEATKIKNQIEDELTELDGSISKLKNEFTLRRGKISDIKNKISILGSGDLEIGFERIDEIKNLQSLINTKKKELHNIIKMIEINDEHEHTSFTQTFGASINYLRQASLDVFKNFMVETLQVMDLYFKHQEVDPEYMLSNQLINWYNEGVSKHKYKPSSFNYNHIDKESSNNSQNSNTKRKNNILEHFISPNLKLKSDKRTLELVIPEKIFTRGKYNNINPKCKLNYMDGNTVDIELVTHSQHNDTVVYEYSNKISKLLSSLSIHWQNIRDYFEFSFDIPLVFDSNGNKVDKLLLDNDIYFILAHENWNTTDEYISKHNSDIEDYFIYEVEINESSFTLVNELDNAKICYIASKYSNIGIEDLNIAEGILSKELQVITGNLPTIVYNKQILDDKDLVLWINIDDYTTNQYNLSEISKSSEKDSNLCRLDLNDIKDITGRYIYPVKLEYLIKDNNENIIFNGKYIWTSNTEFNYEKNEIIIKYPSKSRVKHSHAIIIKDKAKIPLLNEVSEEIEIYYDKHGGVKYQVEIPKISVSYTDNSGNIVELDKDYLKDELKKIKDYYINFEVIGSIAKSIGLSNSNDTFNIRLPLKNNKAKIKIDEIRDLFCESCDEDNLLINWIGKNACGNYIEILKIYKNWIVSEIEINQEEQETQYLIELTYNQNFEYKGTKYLHILNQGTIVIEKELENDSNIFYINKDSITSQEIEIEIYRKKESGLFGSKKDLAGQTVTILKSAMKEIDNIKRNGLILKSFMYFKENNSKEKYELNPPLNIINIIDSENKNFTEESLFEGEINIGESKHEVIFYIDTERKRLPLLLDIDRDGAQYDNVTKEVFWEVRKGEHILAPIEDFTYEIEGS